MEDEKRTESDHELHQGDAENRDVVLPRRGLPLWRWVLTLVGLYLGAMLYGLDTTIAADVQGPVYQDFGDIEKLSWVGLGFPLASVAVILISGRLYGLFNIKWLILTYIFLFEAGSAICGSAPVMNALIIGRVIAGVGGAGMYLGALTYLSVYTATHELPLYNALIGLSWGTGAILGPVVGGAFSQSSATWRWAFYINLPLAALLSPVYFFVTPSYDPKPSMSRLAKLRSLDLAGAFLNAGVFVMFIITATFSGSDWAWNSARSKALWTFSGIFLIAFVLQQSFSIFTTTEDRLFPVHFLKSRSLVLLYIGTACSAVGMSVTLYYVPLFFQFTRGDDALEAAIRLLPFICLYIFSVMFAGALLPRTGRYAPWYLAGGLFMTAGSALMFTVRPETSTQKVYGYEILIAVGTGLAFQSAYGVAVAKVGQREAPNAIGFINVAQIGTIALSLAIAACLFQNLGFHALRNALGAYNFSDADLHSALAGAKAKVLHGAGQQVALLATDAVAHTICKIFAMVIAAGSLLSVVSLFMKWEKLGLNPTSVGV